MREHQIRRRFAGIVMMLLLFTLSSFSQSGIGANPFDLVHRLNETERIAAVAPSGNPFDIVPAAQIVSVERQREEEEADRKFFVELSQKDAVNPVPVWYRLSVFLPVLLLLVMILALFRERVKEIPRSIVNMNVASLVYRESKGKANPHVVPGFIFTIFSFSLFLVGMFLDEYIGRSNFFLAFLVFFIIVFGYLFLKYILTAMVGFLFPAKKEMDFYRFNIGTFNYVLALVAFLFSALFFFGPENVRPILKYAFAGLAGIWVLVRILRGLAIGGKFLGANIFGFFIYLCTVEIAPVVIVLKLAGLILAT